MDLGHVISAAGVSPDPAKFRVLADWPTPNTVCERQFFLEFVYFYRNYILDATELTAPLYDLNTAREGDESIKLIAEHFESFKEIKCPLCSPPPRLANSGFEQPFILYTDASKIAIGAVLLQRDNSGVERAISFLSNKLSPAKPNYYTFKRECLAIICALEHF